MRIWLNDNYIDRDDASISIEDRGYLLGHGIFDTMCAKDNELIEPQRHYQRLCKNAFVLSLPVPEDFTLNKFEDIALTLLEDNGLSTAMASIRTTLTGGKGERGLMMPQHPSPNMLISATALSFDLPMSPATLITASVKRNEGSPLSQIKSIDYGDNILAKEEATKAGADDALMLNNQDYVCCTTVTNIFFIDEHGGIVTPPLSDGVLAGTTREALLEDGSVQEKSIHIKDIGRYRSAFMTNSLIGKRYIQKIDDVSFTIPDEAL